jgi:hypothetical protein
MLRTAEFIEILTARRSLVAPDHVPRESEVLGARGGSPLSARDRDLSPETPSAKSPVSRNERGLRFVAAL